MLYRIFSFTLVLLITGLSTPESNSTSSDQPTFNPHKFHVSYARMAIENGTAVCRIRFFKHDLETGLQVFAKDPAYKLAPTSKSDAVFTRYFNQKFVLEVGGKQIKGRVMSSGEEDAEDKMWWYMIKFEVPQNMKTFKVTNKLLFDLFADQRNIFKVQTFPSEKSKSFYFTDGAEQYTVRF